jgi:hypothetical protein
MSVWFRQEINKVLRLRLKQRPFLNKLKSNQAKLRRQQTKLFLTAQLFCASLLAVAQRDAEGEALIYRVSRAPQSGQLLSQSNDFTPHKTLLSLRK